MPIALRAAGKGKDISWLRQSLAVSNLLPPGKTLIGTPEIRAIGRGGQRNAGLAKHAIYEGDALHVAVPPAGRVERCLCRCRRHLRIVILVIRPAQVAR